MMFTGIFAAVAVVLVGSLALWANPKRRINQLFFTASLHVALWLICNTLARATPDGLNLLRLSSVVGAVVPFHLWILKDVIVNPSERLVARLSRLSAWVIFTLALAILPLTYWFVPAYSTSENPVYGFGYYAYVSGLLIGYGVLCQGTLSKLRQQTGVAKIELQIALLGGSAAATIVLVLMGLRTVVVVPGYLQPIVILVFYAFTAVTITTHRIFDARHLLLIAFQRGVLLVLVTTGGIALEKLASPHFPPTFTMIVIVLFVLLFASWLNARLDAWMLRFPKAVQARHAAFTAAQSEVRTEELREEFRKVLNGWGQTDRSVLLIEADGELRGDELSSRSDSPIMAALEDVQWATPERLDRERETPERRLLAAFLREHNLGVLVWEKGPTMRLVVGVGVRPSRRPFTFPEVNQLRELASIFESALSRTQLLAKAQRAEQLATVGLLGASVAHEIRNPLVSIKTFAQLLPKHYDDPKFRERFSRIIGEEVSRIDRLTEQLLDLAAPRNFQRMKVSLHEITQSSVDLVTGRVSSRNVQLHTRYLARPDVVWSDPNGLKQVIINLCFNAVQAQEVRGEENAIVVHLETRNTRQGIELTVADEGPGIPPEARVHLFEPFHSTKSNGFGLGLTICGDILASLDSSITLDPYEPGRGAVFRVTLPCPPPSS